MYGVKARNELGLLGPDWQASVMNVCAESLKARMSLFRCLRSIVFLENFVISDYSIISRCFSVARNYRMYTSCTPSAGSTLHRGTTKKTT